MRNSWLALAMKSARVARPARDSVRSRKVSSGDEAGARVGGEQRDADLEQALDRTARSWHLISASRSR